MLTIRLARVDEREELEALQWRASLANETDRPHLETHPGAIDLPVGQIEKGHVFVAEREGRIVGFAALVPEQDHVELDGLFVEPAMWRNGAGARLVDAATLEARQRGQSLLVVANPAARGFYERCGFKLEGEAPTRFGTGLRMSR